MKRWIAFLSLTPLVLTAAPLKNGTFTKIVNDVRLAADRSTVPAKVGDKLPDHDAVTTGAQSRAELRFADRSISRLGADSVFKLEPGTRTVDLLHGVMLLQVPQQLGGAKVRTATITAVVTGTTLMVEYQPKGYVKFIVLEGDVDVFRNDKPSVFTTIHTGDMLIMKPGGAAIPAPVQVDLHRLKQTSKLLDEREFGPLGSVKQLTEAEQQQARDLQRSQLARTALKVPGRGLSVQVDRGLRDQLSAVPDVPTAPTPTISKTKSTATTGTSVSTGPSKYGRPTVIGGVAVIDNASSLVTDPTISASFNGSVGTATGKIYRPRSEGALGQALFGGPTLRLGASDFLPDSTIDQRLQATGMWSAFAFTDLHLIGAPQVDVTDGPTNLLLASQADITLSDVDPFNPLNANTGTWNLATSGLKNVMLAAHDDVVWNAGFSIVGTDQNLSLYTQTGDISFGGAALVDLTAGTLEANAARDLNVTGTGRTATTLKADTVKLSAERNVRIGSAAMIQAPTAINIRARGSITITDSAQLRYLSNRSVQELTLVAEEGDVNVGEKTGALLDGSVTLIESQEGNVSIVNSTLSANYLQAHTLAPNGNLTIGNSTLTGRSGVKLYAEGSNGTVQFIGNTTLDGPATIAGHTVQVDPGVTVNVKTPNAFNVFSDVSNYNTGGHGNFSRNGTPLIFVPASSTGPHKDSFSARPAF